ncbi:Aspartyl protease [Nonomuraea solani]|uniref:Aspartyl protease n=1 Tax=Nonomuraea solani TaxID=1144553 RepID=A0A1H6EVE5_9ACTN|nr:tetratricopeptide repeat protein [Nonomuraea solani]SEH00895.1 Aspartyl protease [Nonomuraea solani]
MVNDGKWDRRSLLRGAAVVAGGGDADALFKAGEFEQAGRAYEEILKTDPENVHAARRRGYAGLLANQFPDAEKYLKMAIELAPDDKDAHRFLADCYIRQDKLALSVPHWRAAGQEGSATLFAAFRGEPYQIHGDIAQVRWLQTDPQPLLEGVSINGGPSKRFTFYTGAASLEVSATVAKEAGLSAVASSKMDYLNGKVWRHGGVLESFKLGGIEVRNLPVSWMEWESGGDVTTENDGMIGTWVFYHFLTTFDYAGRQLILRRRTPETAGKARAAAEPLPLWLARETALHSRGSIAGVAGSGSGVVGVGFGGTGEVAAGVHEGTAKQLGIRIDYDRPVETFGHSRPVVTYPCYPKEIRLGNAVAKDIYGYTNPSRPLDPNGFDSPAHFPHSFFKPYNVTLDFTGMNLYIARGPAT